jgi:biotin transport system substrate-specific component
MKPIVARANTELRTTSTRELAITGLFVSLIAAGSQISIPLGPVPFTLQVFFVFLTSAILPAKKAFLAQFLYLLLGFFGFPVFSGFRSGLPVLFGPTGGFLLSFPFVAFLTAKARSFAAFQALCLLGLGLLYLIGGFWLGFDLPPYNETLHVVHLVREANEFDRTKIFDRKNNTNSFRSQDDFRFRCL